MKKRFILVFLAFLNIACTSEAPRCSDAETISLVRQIASQETAKQMGAEQAKKIYFTLNAIIRTSTDKDTGSHKCKANLAIHSVDNPDKSTEIPITYNVELTENGKEFFVSVFGL